MKNLFLLVIALTFSIIVNGNPQKADVADNKPVKVTVAEFNENAAG